MYFHDKRLQYPVRVETPDPLFARQLQQAIGGIEGEIRVCLQYFFQAWGARGPTNKYRDMLLHTATEEIGHIEMLATAVAMNLENAPASLAESSASANPLVNAVMGGERPRHVVEGMLQRHLLSTGMAAFPANADGVPFDCSHIYASGNLAADMYANVTAEATGRLLAVRLFNAAKDPGMKDMLSFLIARDTMHQQQWLAVIEELGGSAALPIPNSFDQSRKRPSSATCSWARRPMVRHHRPGALIKDRRLTGAASSRRGRMHPLVTSLFWVRRGRTAGRRSSKSDPNPAKLGYIDKPPSAMPIPGCHTSSGMGNPHHTHVTRWRATLRRSIRSCVRIFSPKGHDAVS